MNKHEVFAALRAKGITKVVVSFSGGNDEGGADGATATLDDGSERDFMMHHSVYQNYDTKKYVVGYGSDVREATAAERDEALLSEALEAPIYDQWGGFAGDFHVNGTLTWNAVTQKVEMTGQESVEHYESFERDL